ncbi:hypothetical protein BCR36DRAFT_416848 [Piromyces finnis]|uniref:Uncharacterized protein n=1 Tax=Piromyces finnis TaxID=1754191 RepID=A0A1Y1UUU0_9FUNG|nr:hypothetical protein BCR36DRAFT_416848 [Piromyces finnis]|eukprot:ORX41344.1 hypothetical protein BCR36DRAFT_416848 [Piromyces finnis]
MNVIISFMESYILKKRNENNDKNKYVNNVNNLKLCVSKENKINNEKDNNSNNSNKILTNINTNISSNLNSNKNSSRKEIYLKKSFNNNNTLLPNEPPNLIISMPSAPSENIIYRPCAPSENIINKPCTPSGIIVNSKNGCFETTNNVSNVQYIMNDNIYSSKSKIIERNSIIRKENDLNNICAPLSPINISFIETSFFQSI